MRVQRHKRGELRDILLSLKVGQKLIIGTKAERINVLHSAKKYGVKIVTRERPEGGYVGWTEKQTKKARK